MKNFVSRAYNSFTIDGDVLIKSSTESKLKDEAYYYENIPDNIKHHFPKYYGQEYIDNKYYLKLEYLKDYRNLGDYLINSEDIGKFELNKIFKCLSDFSSIKKPYNHLSNIEMYIDKTEREYLNLLKNPVFDNISQEPILYINLQKYKNFELIWKDIIEKIMAFKVLDFTMIHGDFCLANILYCKRTDDIKLIDPRGSFGEKGIFGDKRYDYAKLLHSLDGLYEFIINDKFSIINQCGDYIDYYINSTDTSKFLKSLYMDSWNNSSIFNEIKLIQGLIYIGMCARHYDSLDRQIVMYATGIRILNECL